MNKPDPTEIARYMNEDEFGLPLINAGPEFNQGSDESEQCGDTKLAQCSAISCQNNHDGLCCLSSININDHGGCEQYEAGSDDYNEDDGRYEEVDTDVSGDIDTQTPTTQDRHWQTGKWDPRGSSV